MWIEYPCCRFGWIERLKPAKVPSFCVKGHLPFKILFFDLYLPNSKG